MSLRKSISVWDFCTSLCRWEDRFGNCHCINRLWWTFGLDRWVVKWGCFLACTFFILRKFMSFSGLVVWTKRSKGWTLKVFILKAGFRLTKLHCSNTNDQLHAENSSSSIDFHTSNPQYKHTHVYWQSQSMASSKECWLRYYHFLFSWNLMPLHVFLCFSLAKIMQSWAHRRSFNIHCEYCFILRFFCYWRL